MGKKSRRRRKPKRHAPSISPLVLLRPRLDGLLGNEALAERDSQTLKSDLDAIFEGLKTYDFLPVLLRACQSAGAQAQERLDDIVPEWLNERGYADTLSKLLERHGIHTEGREKAFAWLESAGSDTATLREMERQTPFCQGYTYADDSQATIEFFWYTDSRRRKVRGMCFLLDFNPPWEGAVKDVMLIPSRSPENAVREYVDTWKQRGMIMSPIGESEVKGKILEGLEANRREGIRLPRDLIFARELFVKYVLTLSGTPDTPPFTAEDFDKLSRTGKSVEGIRQFEQTVGRRVRMDDGKEILVMGDPLDEDDWE